MKKIVALACCYLSLNFLNMVNAQSLDFANTIYYTAAGNTLTSSGQTLAGFNYSSAPSTHPIFNDGIYYPQIDYLNHNFWVRVRHIADDPNGTSVGHNVAKTSSSPFRDNGFGGWWGFLYQFDVYADANLTGVSSNTLNGLYPLNITVESIETLSYPEWVSFELLNPESSNWVLNSRSFTGNNPGSSPGFSAVNIPYSQVADFSTTFPAASKNIYAIQKGGTSYAEFRMSAADVSQFRYGYEYPDNGGYQGFRLSFGSQSIGLPLQKPGSGTNLHFNGIADGVDLGNAFNDENFTVELWVKPGATQVQYADIMDNNHVPGANWAIQQNDNNTNQYYCYVSGTSTDNFNLAPGVWQHLGFVKSAAELLIYVNGMLVNTTPWSGTINYSSNFLRLGRYGGGGRNWNGSMDEVRIWNSALSQAEIRDRLCHKIAATDPLYNNLKAYYNLDEGSGAIVVDSKTKISSVFNGPTWETSGAPIGNFSAHNYSGGTSVINLAHPNRGDELSATLTAGLADGIHVYFVTEKPNTSNGITGVGSNDAYFGVFMVNGSNPAYNAVYNFDNVFLNNNRSDFHLYKRADNAATLWADCNATIDVNANTLTTNGQHTEYMLGSVGAGLPISALLFEAQKDDAVIKLTWHTLTEINSSSFEVERSKNGTEFFKLTKVPAAGNSNTIKNYAYTDISPEKDRNYYRLKQIDINGKFIYSSVRLVNFIHNANITIYPNPVKKGQSIQLGLQNITANKIEIINAMGQVVYSNTAKQQGTVSLNISGSLAAGEYVIRVIYENLIVTRKLVIQ